ncbi:vacuolar protein sorting-associated protein 13 [Trichodelitschia bisporula]|uniref:Vacuolar protein sorting-associated protein n=1 Tax=Trichodelitschia bisporula TaxID=703511 RepID=A0A6G1HXF8_9PEZI|nr:vacuolar protein sorting-associated protein 13 [Trichodelitschia bisporula]
MLEGLVANLLNRFLGMYVQNFDAKQLNVGIWSGDVKLRNLELRREALDQLHLPLNVVAGHLGQLTLQIPWSNLRGKPVQIHIEDVYLLAAPREDADYDPEEEERRAHAVKMEKLDSAELLKERNTEGMTQEEQKKNQTFTASLVTAIVDNVQVTVKNIHIRYEDSISDPGHPFALGITLEGFDAVSTNENWHPTFIQSTSSTAHKLASLKSLAVYWDTDTKLLGTGKGSQKGIDHETFLENFSKMIVKGNSPEIADHQFILKPVTGRAGLEIDKTGKADRPKIKAKLLFDELGFIIDSDQYRDALMLVDLFHYFIRHQEYKKLQPKSKPMEDPRGWLQFAAKAVLDKIHDRNRRWSWEYFKERRDDRNRYIDLFKKKKREEKLTHDETTELEKLEHKLTYEDLRFWRSLARNQLRKENVGVKKPPPKQTWTQWAWGGGAKQQNDSADNSQMSEEQRKELYKAINFDEKQSIAEEIQRPREYVKFQAELSLRTGSFTLKRDPHGKKTEILKLLFDSFKTEFQQRTDSFLMKLSLEGMRLYDGTIEDSLFPQIISIKDAPPVPDDQRVEELDDDAEAEHSEKFKDLNENDADPDDPFFQMAFENRPLDGSADTALTLKLKGMEIVYNPTFIVEVVKFFKPPERHMESIGALMETAGATVESIRQQTRAGLEFALEEHKTINAQIEIQAPLIIIPDSVTKKSTLCLIVDAGHASVSSELVDTETIRDIQSKQRQKLSEEDFRKLKGLMYDKFNLKLTSTQVLIGTSVEETRAQLTARDPAKSLHIIDRINMDFLIEACIVPKGTDLTKLRISGHLPVLQASISDQKYKNLMKLIDVAIPKFDDGPKKDSNGHSLSPDIKHAVDASAGVDGNMLTKQQSGPFSFSPQQHDLVVDDESVMSEPVQFEDAPESCPQPAVPIHQKNFEFQFTVDKLQGSLYRADADGKDPDRLLVELVAEHFYLNFQQRAHDMAADVRLRSLAVEDHIEDSPLPEFKNIVSSEESSSSSQQDLFQLKFIKVNRDSPEFLSKYEGIGMNLDVSVSTINLIVTRRTLLTLLDFILVTFTNPGQLTESEKQQKAIESSGEPRKDSAQPQSQDADKIRIKANLHRIAVILNNDGIRLATLGLNTADVSVFLSGNTMQIGAHLGQLSLIDDVNQGVPETSALRQLVTIQGDELAHFRYETFDHVSDAYPGYDTSIYLRSGSIKVNFVTEPFRKIMDFGVKFGKMQAIFNAARQAAANQASQMQERANKMHFDILIRTPIVVFPRMVVTDAPERDRLTAYLGEIYAKNEFKPLDEAKKSDFANNITAGIRNIRLASLFHYEENKSEELQMLEKVDIGFGITYIDHQLGYQRPDLEIEGSMSDINLKISQDQMRFALELSQSIPAAFALEADEELEEQVEEELPDSTVDAASPERTDRSRELPKPSESVSSLNPELGSNENTWTTLDLVFKVGAIGMELIKGKDNQPIGDIAAASLSQFSLNKTHVKVRMISDGALESELLVQSFTIIDSRTHETNKFRKIMSLINSDVRQQFMASVSISGGKNKNLVALLTIDSPRIILALDYLFAIKGFIDAGLATDNGVEITDGEEEEELTSRSVSSSPSSAAPRRQSVMSIKAAPQETPEPSVMDISFRVNVVDAQIVLLANPAITTSEAIVLGTKQILVAKQHVTTLQIDKVGMFLCRMDQFEKNRMRILDDFSISTSVDMRGQAENSSITNIDVDIEPLVLRLSLRDILLAMQIVNRASLMSEDSSKMEDGRPKAITQQKSSTSVVSRSRSKSVTKSTAAQGSTIKSAHSRKASEVQQRRSSALITRETMHLAMHGIRVVLIGEKHELPMLDWSVKRFAVEVRDWSASMTADTSIDTFINVYNFSQSAWEPLIEPWLLGFHMTKEQNPEKLGVEIYSRKPLELTVTAATIALASKSLDFFSTDEDMLSKPRRMEAPYRIRNHTGFSIDIWAENSQNEDGAAAKLEDGEEIPWRFEDPLTTRETLAPEGATGLIGVRLDGSGFNSLTKIPVNREGEALYQLLPRKDRVQHRLLVEVKLGVDNVKYITFQSPLLVENNTQIPIELGVFSPETGDLLKIEKISPGDARPAPVGAAYVHSLIVRPDQGFGYTWSAERLYWKDLLRKPTRTLTCRGDRDDNSPPFFFQSHAAFDSKNPLTSTYPYMRIRLHAPVEIQNLLPYDFKYRIYDNNTKKDWTNFLRKGGVSPVHVVELSHLLMMSVDLQDTPFKQSEFTMINSSDREGFRREKSLTLKDENDLTLRLKLHYFNIPNSGGAFKVTIYSPYVILNRTGLQLDVRSKVFLGAPKAAAGQSAQPSPFQEPRKTLPFMFSFPNDDKKNRALIKIGDSQWSKPQSFDAIGSQYSVSLPSPSGRAEMNIGVSVEEGKGKYSLSKVVTITPRFIIKNKIGEDLNVREPGSSEIMTLKNGELLPLRYLRQGNVHQLCLCYPGVNNAWSSPFDISNVGNVHVKLAKARQRQKLIRIDVLLEEATIFLHISVETKHWPFSMRNESNVEFLFWQANPNVDDDEDDTGSGWKPIRYKLPARSVMPYAWDFPAARKKEIVLSVNGKEKSVRLAEIGNPPPMKLPPSAEHRRGAIIDLNIVADGPTQTLILSNFKQSKSLYRQRSTPVSQSSMSGFEVKEVDTDVTFTAQLRLAGLGISLVNQQLKELIYVTLRDIELKYSDSPLYQTLKSTIKWIQIDNQLYGGIFPIIFYPSVVPKTGKEMEAHPILHAAVTRVKDDSYGVLYIKYFTILLQQMTVELDEDFIFALLDFVKIPGASWSEEQEGKLCDDTLDIPEPQQEQNSQDIYFELLHLQPMQFDISFVRTERINAEDTMTSSSPLMFFVNVLTMSVGNVNDAPIRYNALMLENARVSTAALINSIKTHYVQESLRQVHVVLGSADFLGNPVGLFNNISSGVQDIFYEPYQGLVMTDRPQDLGIGIAKGAGSFVKKSIFGFSDSMAKFTGSMSKGLAAATMDKEFQDRRRISRSRNRPKHALYGITSGGNAFAESLASGIGGMARHPLQGAEREGVAGFVKGVGKGVLGLATKPAIGAFDLASNMAEGVRNTTTVFDQEGLDRVRMPRFIGQDGVVRPYSQREALGQFWLKTLDAGKHFHEEYIAHLELTGKDLMVMLTYNGILLVKMKRLQTEWDVPLKDVQTISKERTGIVITLKGGTNGPFVPVPNAEARDWLYRQIAVAVTAYNEKWNARG